jgi:hypothetical protein
MQRLVDEKALRKRRHVAEGKERERERERKKLKSKIFFCTRLKRKMQHP